MRRRYAVCIRTSRIHVKTSSQPKGHVPFHYIQVEGSVLQVEKAHDI